MFLRRVVKYYTSESNRQCEAGMKTVELAKIRKKTIIADSIPCFYVRHHPQPLASPLLSFVASNVEKGVRKIADKSVFRFPSPS